MKLSFTQWVQTIAHTYLIQPISHSKVKILTQRWVCNSNPLCFLSNSANCSLQPSSCVFCVCVQNNSGVHTQSLLCKWETNKVAQTKPLTFQSINTISLGAQNVTECFLLFSLARQVYLCSTIHTHWLFKVLYKWADKRT